MKSRSGLSVFIVAVVFLSFFGFLSATVDVSVDEDGSYSILVDEKVWFKSSSLIIRSNGKWLSSADGSLVVTKSSIYAGNDVWGPFTGISVTWKSSGSSEMLFQTLFKTYQNFAGVVFDQIFSSGLQNANLHQDNEVLASFPSFSKPKDSPLFYLTFNDTFGKPLIANFSQAGQSHFGVGNGGPVAFWGPSSGSSTTCIISPVNNFMTNIQTLSHTLNNDLAFGIIGQVNDLPVNFTHSSIFICGEGMNATFWRWGQLLQQYYSTTRQTPSPDDFTHPLNVLGYWTDNGGYYYYNTEPGMNYEDTLLDLDIKLKQSFDLPIRYWQLDSWWYTKGINDGVKLWESRSDIFPHGMGYLHDHLLGNKTKSFILHNRYFAPDNDYVGKYPFAVEEKYSLPLTSDLFFDIMNKAKSWGMSIYEQDWLSNTYLYMASTKNSTTTSRQWMLNMDRAASSLNVTILLCMALPRHILQSLECPSMVYNRVSDDYLPARELNWQVNYQSLFTSAIGLIPFKDDFFSNSENENGCPFSTCTEPHPIFHSILSSLLTGFVAPSDGIDYVVADVIMSTCRADGYLLKPDKPLTLLDSILFDVNLPKFPYLPEVGSAFTEYDVKMSSGSPSSILSLNNNEERGRGRVRRKYSSIKWNNHKSEDKSVPLRWYYIVALIDERFPSYQLDLVSLDVPDLGTTYVIKNTMTASYQVFNISTSASINNDNWSYQVAAPVIPGTRGFVLMGESSKWVYMSKQRVPDVRVVQGVVYIEVIGSPDEEVVLEYLSTADLTDVRFFPIQISSTGRSLVACREAPLSCKDIS